MSRTASGRHRAVIDYQERIEAIQHEAEPKLQALNRDLSDYLEQIKSDPPPASREEEVTPVIDLMRTIGRLGGRDVRAIDACAICAKRYPGGDDVPGWCLLVDTQPADSIACSDACRDLALARQRKYGRIDR